MNIKASGRSALILATGLFVCFAGPSQAATGADGAAASSKSERRHGSLRKQVRTSSRHWKRYAHRKSGKVGAEILRPPRKPRRCADDGAANSSAIPPSVANANAQLASADTPRRQRQGDVRAGQRHPAGAGNPADAQPAADTQVVAADQLNDVDRALHESNARRAAAPLAMASADAPVAPQRRRWPAADESSTWDQTSLIGKIFIGFGALLTMASAARMFMA